MQNENIIENQIKEFGSLVNDIDIKLNEEIKARILYKNCPLCESSNISESVIGDCSKHTLYNPKIPSKMQWMNCEDCLH